MRFVVDKPRARFLPTRCGYAIARVVAFIRFQTASEAKPVADRVVHSIDRDHNAIENYCVSAFVVAITYIYIASALPLQRIAACVVAIPLAIVAVHIPFAAVGLPLSLIFGDNRKAISLLHMFLLLGASMYFAGWHSAVRYVAWVTLGITLLNAAAAVIMFLLRGRVAEMERACGL